MMNLGKNFGMNNVAVAALSVDGRFTHKIHMYAVRKYCLALDLNGLRQVACEKLSVLTGNRVVIPQANSRIYFGMAVNPNPLEQQLNNYALSSGFTLRVNRLTDSGREKDVDSMNVADSISYGNTIAGYGLVAGDRDFTTIFQEHTSTGKPCLLYTARFENTYCSHELKEAATEVIDVLSLLGDRRVFKPVQQANSRGKTIAYHTRYNNFHPQNLTTVVEQAIKRVMQRNSYPGKPAVFAYQSEVAAELQNMGQFLKIPLSVFLSSRSWKFCTGFYDQRATVSLR